MRSWPRGRSIQNGQSITLFRIGKKVGGGKMETVDSMKSHHSNLPVKKKNDHEGGMISKLNVVMSAQSFVLQQ